jgi:hypothetical protein
MILDVPVRDLQPGDLLQATKQTIVKVRQRVFLSASKREVVTEKAGRQRLHVWNSSTHDSRRTN